MIISSWKDIRQGRGKVNSNSRSTPPHLRYGFNALGIARILFSMMFSGFMFLENLAGSAYQA